LSTLGTVGDVLPLARLAPALVARGHDLTLHSWPMYQALLEVPGARFVAAASAVTEERLQLTTAQALRAAHPAQQVAQLAQLFYVESAAAYYARICQLLAGADLAILNVLDHVAQAAAEVLCIPWVGWRSRPPPLGPRAVAEDAILAECDTILSEHLAQVTGQPGRRFRIFREPSPLLDLVAVSPRLLEDEATPHGGNARTAITGHWLPADRREELPPALMEFLAVARRPIVFVTFGRMPDVSGRTRAVLQAGQAAGVSLVVQALDAPSSRTAESLVIPAALSYPSVFACVDAVLHHGGMGTTHEVCRAALPSFAIPHMGDQYYWAQRLTACGLGPALLPHTQLAPHPLAQRLQTLVQQPTYRARAQALAPALREEDGVTVALRRLDPLLSAG